MAFLWLLAGWLMLLVRCLRLEYTIINDLPFWSGQTVYSIEPVKQLFFRQVIAASNDWSVCG